MSVEAKQDSNYGILYVVATPIGHLQDMTFRAIEVLKSVDRILCEDTRHSSPLLRHFGIAKPLLSLHNFNERERIDEVLRFLKSGEHLALISDAGTPLISDPGYPLVHSVKMHGMNVVPVPGACAAIAALSVSGLPTDRFIFEGFLPSKLEAKRQTLQALSHETRTLIFYESPYRVLETLQAMQDCFGAKRQVAVAKELTKMHEMVRTAEVADQVAYFTQHQGVVKGEFVLIVEGAPAVIHSAQDAEIDKILTVLLEELPLKQAVKIAAQLTGERKNVIYERALGKKGGIE